MLSLLLTWASRWANRRYAVAYRRHDAHVTMASVAPPDSKVHGANMGPTWVLSAPDGPHVGPMNIATRAYTNSSSNDDVLW